MASIVPAKEVHRLAISSLGPILKADGFGRLSGTSSAAWQKPWEDRFLVCWVQPSQSWDPLGWWGSSFTINIELPKSPSRGGNGPRARFVGLLSAGDREILRAAQMR